MTKEELWVGVLFIKPEPTVINREAILAIVCLYNLRKGIRERKRGKYANNEMRFSNEKSLYSQYKKECYSQKSTVNQVINLYGKSLCLAMKSEK